MKEEIVKIICDNSSGVWRRGSDGLLLADEVDVNELSRDIIMLYSSKNK